MIQNESPFSEKRKETELHSGRIHICKHILITIIINRCIACRFHVWRLCLHPKPFLPFLLIVLRKASSACLRITCGTYADFMTTAAAPSHFSLNPAAAGRSRQPPVNFSFRCPLEEPLPPEGHGSCVHQVPELPSPAVPLPPEERSAASP